MHISLYKNVTNICPRKNNEIQEHDVRAKEKICERRGQWKEKGRKKKTSAETVGRKKNTLCESQAKGVKNVFRKEIGVNWSNPFKKL